MEEVKREVTPAGESFEASDLPPLQEERPGSPSTAPETSSTHDSTTRNEASVDDDIGVDRSISLLTAQSSTDEPFEKPERKASFFATVGLFRVLGVFNRKKSDSHHRGAASPSTPEDTQQSGESTHSVDVTSSGISQAVMVGDPTPQSLHASRPRMPSGTSRTWLILLSMIGAFFLCFWLMHPFYDLDADEPTEPSPAHSEFINYGAVETNEVKELLEDEAPL
ncbi:hypothetical protein MTO96_002863 [Rhipicephalus appendiculatus]